MYPEFFEIVARSLLVSGTAVLLATAVGIPCGLLAAGLPSRWRRPTQILVYSGMSLPPVVVGVTLYLLLSRTGPLGQLGWLFTIPAMILAQTILALPFVAGVTMTAVAAVPRDLAEQMFTLGANRLQCWIGVLRESQGGLVFAVAAALGRSLSEVGAVLMIGGNIEGHTRVMTTAVVLETSRGNFHLALALGGVLLLMAISLNAAILLVPVAAKPT